MILRLTHTGVNPNDLLIADIYDATDGIFFKAGPPYIPFGATVDMTLSDDVVYSFRSGNLDGMITAGWLTYQFVVSPEFVGALEGFKAGTTVFAAGIAAVAVVFTDVFTVPYAVTVSAVDTGDGGNYNVWVSNQLLTGFTINLSMAPAPGTTVSVAWVAVRNND